jgi:hypothetical protein
MKLIKKKVPKKIKKTKPAKKRSKKVVTLAKGIDIVKKSDGTYVISGKNAKSLDGAVVERKERAYKFDERLVPYYLGADSKDGNLTLREALIKLGKTPEMTNLFAAMKSGNMGYNDDAKEIFLKALYTIIKGHDEVGLVHVYEEDIQAIHENNLKTFNEFWDARTKTASDKEDEFSGFSN